MTISARFMGVLRPGPGTGAVPGRCGACRVVWVRPGPWETGTVGMRRKGPQGADMPGRQCIGRPARAAAGGVVERAGEGRARTTGASRKWIQAVTWSGARCPRSQSPEPGHASSGLLRTLACCLRTMPNAVSHVPPITHPQGAAAHAGRHHDARSASSSMYSRRAYPSTPSAMTAIPARTSVPRRIQLILCCSACVVADLASSRASRRDRLRLALVFQDPRECPVPRMPALSTYAWSQPAAVNASCWAAGF